MIFIVLLAIGQCLDYRDMVFDGVIPSKCCRLFYDSSCIKTYLYIERKYSKQILMLISLVSAVLFSFLDNGATLAVWGL